MGGEAAARVPTCPPIRGAVTESHTHVIMSVSQRVEHWAQEGPRGACVWGQHVPGQRVCGDSVCVLGQRVCAGIACVCVCGQCVCETACVYWDSV